MLSKRTTPFVAGCGAAALLAAAPAMAGGGWHGRGGPPGLTIIETFDLDRDGKVTQAEIDQARKEQLAKHDADRDGVLDLAEYQALWAEAMRRAMVRQFQANDSDGDGSITVEEFTDRFARLVVMADRNDDGALTADELRRRGPGRQRGPWPGPGPGPGSGPPDDDNG